MEKKLKSIACKAIDAKVTDLNHISQEIWKNPELNFNEFAAHELLTSYLEKEGFKVARKTPLETSFVARFGNSSGLKVGIICEYDALPDIGHACGHNLIAEAGIGAALGLKATLLDNPELPFEVIVYGTPAEEGGGGKIKMIEKGVFDEVDICMMTHPTPYEIARPLFLGIAQYRVVFKGKASHAAAAPWEGINALDAAVACYNNVSMLRQQMKPTCRIHCTIIDGGKAPNIIPERSELHYYVRGKTDEDTAELLGKLKDCAKGAAVSTGCEMDINECAPYFASVKTNNPMIEFYIKNATDLGVQFNDDHMTDTMTVSTDMGNVSAIKPSIHPLYRIKTDGPNHTQKFAEATGHVDNQLPTLNSAKNMAMTAIDVICNPEVMVKIKEDFKK